MASMINTNISSLNAQRNLTTSQSGLATSLQRLSTGLRINSAKDDAAGMSIASRMTSQINGMNVAARNANDGISLAQTAEGGLNSATDLLQRMRDLAVQSANGSNSDTDRASIQSEVGQLKDEIDRVAKSTSFNGLNLLDGSFTAQSFQVGANAGSNDRIQIDKIANLQTTSLGSGLSGSSSLTSGMTQGALAAGDLTLNGTQVGATASGSQAGQSASSAYAVAQAINAVAGQSGVTAKANATVATTIATDPTKAAAPDGTKAAAVAANSFSINGVNIGAIAKGAVADYANGTAGGTSVSVNQAANVVEAINKVSSQTGVAATVDEAGKVSLASTNGKSITITAAAGYASLTDDTGLTDTAGTPIGGTAPKFSTTGYTAGAISINGVELGDVAGATTDVAQGANTAAAINKISGKTGVTATSDAVSGMITLSAADGRDIKIDEVTAGDAKKITGIDVGTTHGTVTLSSSNVNGIVVGGNADKNAGLGAFEGIKGADAKSTNTVSSVDVSTASGALAAISTIDSALSSVNSSKAALGAYQNRFSAVVSNLQATSENLSASRSRIQDADFASETASLTRGQILQQAGTAMLAQANSLPNGVLALLRG
ncbi:flagellin [Massilia sp. R2A-15]|uniref:flagellin N-terminal helical domain-containing protein n=1 Tax=Massilia sp. R2A-15 TaxID=3064278 RepID=UPI002733E833|nr:flagellin [Massilia sp. R2A-15]WLI87964.1 flagellin [Massilia sp. R2A-15]